MTNPMNRRTALSLLGLAPTAVIAGEDLGHPLPPREEFRFNINAKISDALRKLADDIDAQGTFVQRASLTTEASVESFLFHRLTIEFALREEAAKANRWPIT